MVQSLGRQEDYQQLNELDSLLRSNESKPKLYDTKVWCFTSRYIVCGLILLMTVTILCITIPMFFDQCGSKPNTARRNVLVILIDDLRPEIGAYIDTKSRPWLNPRIHTPNIDAFASHSAVFSRAFVQLALCNPSRTSLLTSRRPDTTRVFDNYLWFRDSENPDIITLPQYFLENNFETKGFGKIFHLMERGRQDRNRSWTSFEGYHSQILDADEKEVWRAVPDNVTEVTPLIDQVLTQDAIKALRDSSASYNETGKNFFIAVGYRRPHLPWVFPQQFLSLYPMNSIDLPPNPFAPYEMPFQAWSKSEEIMKRTSRSSSVPWVVNSTFDHFMTKAFRRAYYSCVSHIDHEIGLLLDNVKQLGLLDSTVIALLGDHGWHLGEHSVWGKNTNFEEATNAPLMLRIPGLTDTGLNISGMVEFVDLFPSLVEAAGLPQIPLCPKRDSVKVDLCREGSSLLPMLRGGKGKKAVFSQYPFHPSRGHYYMSQSMGYSMRTENFRYTEWWKTNGSLRTHFEANELFDLDNDPLQNYNRAGDPKFDQIRGTLSEMLRNGWTALHQESDACWR